MLWCDYFFCLSRGNFRDERKSSDARCEHYDALRAEHISQYGPQASLELIAMDETLRQEREDCGSRAL